MPSSALIGNTSAETRSGAHYFALLEWRNAHGNYAFQADLAELANGSRFRSIQFSFGTVQKCGQKQKFPRFALLANSEGALLYTQNPHVFAW